MTTHLIKTKTDWAKTIKNMQQTKLLGLETKINQKPDRYPCFAVSQVIMDNNGVSIVFNFLYKEDAKKLINL